MRKQTLKQHRLNTAIDWINRTIADKNHYEQYLIMFDYLKFDPIDCLKTMDSKQLKLFSCMAAASMGRGCEMTRKAWRESNKRKSNK